MNREQMQKEREVSIFRDFVNKNQGRPHSAQLISVSPTDLPEKPIIRALKQAVFSPGTMDEEFEDFPDLEIEVLLNW